MCRIGLARKDGLVGRTDAVGSWTTAHHQGAADNDPQNRSQDLSRRQAPRGVPWLRYSVSKHAEYPLALALCQDRPCTIIPAAPAAVSMWPQTQAVAVDCLMLYDNVLVRR